MNTLLRSPLVASLKQAILLQRLRPVLAPAFVRAYTKIEAYTETEHIGPIEMQKFLQSHEHGLRQFLDDETEIVASESFGNKTEMPVMNEHPGKSKAINEEFAKQIQSLLHPDYGTESK